MMNSRENLLSLLRREGYEYAPVYFELCPSLIEQFESRAHQKNYHTYYKMPWDSVSINVSRAKDKVYYKYYKDGLKNGTHIDEFGVAHEHGSEAAKHMTRMISPMRDFSSVEQILSYEFPCIGENYDIVDKVGGITSHGLASIAFMQMTVWETAWYLRGMEELMMDMMCEDEMATVLLDKVTEFACNKASVLANAGVDLIFLGDDIGMQNSIMMSESLYCDWIKPRLKKVVDTIRGIKNDTIILYHSCGYIEPFIPHLIDCGIDVLNPVQPECMDFEKIHNLYGDRLSFHGTLGTQTTMPFGNVADVKNVVKRNLNIAGEKGGLLIAPTHLLEPEVPFENIEAYVKACSEYKL